MHKTVPTLNSRILEKMRSEMAFTKYESGKPVETKRQEVKKDSYFTKYSALLNEVNRIASSLEVFYPAIDELMDEGVRNQKILDRALKLAYLSPEELALSLAKAQIQLELLVPYYKEYEKQCNIFRSKYEQEINKQFQTMEKRLEAKKKSSPHQENFQAAQEILATQEVYNYTAFRRKLNRVLQKEIPDSTSRSYFYKITGLTSTKNSHHLSNVSDHSI